VSRLERLGPRDFILGVNLGKNKDTPQERAADDYRLGMEKVHALADYVTINLSSPNTPGLRDLQHGQALEDLLAALDRHRDRLAQHSGRRLPLVVKIAPDLTPEQLRRQADCFLRHHVDGVIATNTTVDHSAVAHLPAGRESGGLSGAPLRDRATAVVRQLHAILGDALPIIACGGILRPEDALAKFEAGARLVQLYTGLVYRGPALITEILAALQRQRASDSG